VAGSQRFPPARRIRRRPEFQQAYDRGTRIGSRLMTVFVLPRDDSGPTRLGIAATRKLGNACVRNRAKRLVRETFRRHTHPPGLDIVVIPRAALLDAPWQDIEAEYAACVGRRTRRPRPQR
jgi:ribonuclease P protein component